MIIREFMNLVAERYSETSERRIDAPPMPCSDQ